MSERMDGGEIETCCATFYQSDVVRLLLGDVLHPGGLALTRHLGHLLGLGADDHLLDVACGLGISAVHLAEEFGCRVTGLDFGAENIAAAEAHAAERGVGGLARFREGDAERLPFEDGTFDAVLSECSFCTFPDKTTAAAEQTRILKPGGRLGLADMTLHGTLPEDVQSLLAWVACVAGAGTPGDYAATLQAAGLSDLAVEDRRDALLEMVAGVRRKLLGLELAAGLGKLEGSAGLADILDDLDLAEGKRLARRAVELIEQGVVGYSLITAIKMEC